MTTRGLLAENVYRRIRTDLLRGRIRPGAKLTEQWAADHYRASRTPVREACRRLAEEGLLVHRPRHGYSAPVIDTAEISELYDVRRVLENMSVRRACAAENGRGVLAQLRRAWSGDAPDPGEDAVFRDEAFHIGLARLTGSRVLAGMLEGINARIRLVRVHDFLDPGRVSATITQHLEILDAVEARDADRAADLMDAHISESQEYASPAAARALAELGAEDAAG
ncbi:MAG: GntR family transcriptional regulator [Thermoleophilia bacterium]